MNECAVCGADLSAGAKFCGSCGALTERAVPLPVRLLSGLAAIPKALGSAITDIPVRQRRMAAVVLFAFLAVAATWEFLRDDGQPTPQFLADGSPDFANYQDVFVGEEAEYLVTGIANVRNFPTSQQTNILYTLLGGETVRARQVQAFDPSSKWYRLSEGGYIWGGNLFDPSATDGEPAPIFPERFRGRWSSMDICRGSDMNAEIVVSDTAMRFYESTGELIEIVEGVQGDLFRLRLSGEGEQWEELYSIRLSADGRSITLRDAGNGTASELVYFDPELGCDGLVRPF